MKAMVMRAFGGPEVLQLEDFPDPVPGPGEVVVGVKAVSVNRTLDLVVREGRYPGEIKLPHIPGVDPSGEIIAVGEGVTDRKIGDRVVTIPWRIRPIGPMEVVGVGYLGGYAEQVRLPAAATVIIPDGLDFATATIVTRHAPQAYNLLRDRAQVKPGETVLVMGAAGGLGSAAVQIAKALGATVIAAAGAPDRVQAALDLGADLGIDYRATDMAAEAMRLTDGRGVDIVLENIGDPELFTAAIASLARHGRLVTAGSHVSDVAPLNLKLLYLRQLSILGSLGFDRADAEASLQLAAEGRMSALIDRVMPLADAAKAHELVAARQGLGKLILEP